MAVQLIDHVKEEPVHLINEQFKSGRYLQVTDDLKLCVRGQASDSGNVLTFREFSAISEDCTDSPSGDCLVSIQFDHHGANYVVCPYRKRVTWETTLQLRVKKVKLEDTVDRKAERVDKKCRIYWFKLKASKSRACVYESLAYKDFYVSMEGENVLLRKYKHGIPQEENFQIDIFSIHNFAETYHGVTTVERREMVNEETQSIAVIHEDDRLLTSGAYVIGERGEVLLTDLHVTEMKHTELSEEKFAREKSTPDDTFHTEPNVPVDKSPEPMSSDSSEMSSASNDMSSSACEGAKPSTVADVTSVTHGKSTSEQAPSSIKAMKTRSELSFTEHSSEVDKLSAASGCDLSSASPPTAAEMGYDLSSVSQPTAPKVVITERVISSVTELDIKVDDQDLASNTHTPKYAPSALISEEVLKAGDRSGELIKHSGKRSAKKEKKRRRRFALSSIFSCVASRSAD